MRYAIKLMFTRQCSSQKNIPNFQTLKTLPHIEYRRFAISFAGLANPTQIKDYGSGLRSTFCSKFKVIFSHRFASLNKKKKRSQFMA